MRSPAVDDGQSLVDGRLEWRARKGEDTTEGIAAMPHVGVRFDHAISVQEAGAFKPHWRTYAKAAWIVGVDRRRRPFGETPHQPDLVVGDATVLAAALA